MADKEGMERKVYLLPAELVERIKAYQIDQGITSEVEAARRLLDTALQFRDTIESLLTKLRLRWEEEKDLRVLARDVLTNHISVIEITFGENKLSFMMRDGYRGAIYVNGQLERGEGSQNDYMHEWIPPSLRPKPRKGSPNWEAPPKGGNNLDDDIPF